MNLYKNGDPMAKISLLSPIGEEAPTQPGVMPLPDPRGCKIAFLFNGHVSVLPFWEHLRDFVIEKCEPMEIIEFTKPNTFAPAPGSEITRLSEADLAIVGVCA